MKSIFQLEKVEASFDKSFDIKILKYVFKSIIILNGGEMYVT